MWQSLSCSALSLLVRRHQLLRVAPEHLRTVVPGEELPWSEVQKLLQNAKRRLGGAEVIPFEDGFFLVAEAPFGAAMSGAWSLR